MNKSGKYYVGLDIGTGSCGFCVTDENYNVVRKNGKDLWGVKLFDTASVASERRQKRSARRNLQRQKDRIRLLQGLFSEEINKIDCNFFARINASSLWEEDKEKCGLKSKNSLFFDDLLDDKQFYKDYPTIYHLRNVLMKSPAKDIRYVYLAVHNMLKHRGNFLYESFDMSNDNNFIDLFKLLSEKIDEDENFSKLKFENSVYSADVVEKLKQLERAICDKPFKNGWLEFKLIEILGAKNSNLKGLLKAISGGIVNAKTIFASKENELVFEMDKIPSFSCEDEKYLTFKAEVDNVSEAAGEIIEIAKAINSQIEFKRILGHNESISSALVEKYENHKKQLRFFKDEVVRKYYPNFYKEMFSSKNEMGDVIDCNCYAKYINGCDLFSSGDKGKWIGKCSRENFYNYVKSFLQRREDFAEISEVQKVLDWIDENNFLVKLRTSANSVIPYQINKKELQIILNKASENFPFLKEKDDEGLSVIDKIISIFEFRIPYYVGPLGCKNSENSWIVKKLDEQVLPWNFEKVVDLDKCEDLFIERMQNKCTYLKDENVLPKNSLLYSEFMVLQELNNMKVNGEKLRPNVKVRILNEFKSKGKVSVKNIKLILKEMGLFRGDDNIVISGINEDFKVNLNIYKNFNTILEGELESNVEMVENIIRLATLITDKGRFKKRIEALYPNKLSTEQVKKILGLKIEGWGRLSEKFLTGIRCINRETGEVKSIIDTMMEEPLNLMEVIAKYNIFDLIDKKEEKDKISYEDVKELYCSPSVKRGVWQSVKIVDEITKIMGQTPSKIFVEVTRSDGEKGKEVNSRQKQLKNLYNQIKDIDVSAFGVGNLNDLKQNIESNDVKEFNREKLYLYFLQLGKCMYTGEEIDLNNLYTKDYDIDHIIPQSKIKDDGLTNKVLVKRRENIDKGNRVASQKIISKNKPFWQFLLQKGLISNEKYNRLIREDEYTDDELRGFVSRQLVTTNQSVKAVIDLLKSVYNKDCEVIFSKASNVSAFRNCEFSFGYRNNEMVSDGVENIEKHTYEETDEFKELKNALIKCRDLNDLHHAKDAYLNIVVGNVFYEKYTKKFYFLNNDNSNYNFNLNNAFKHKVDGVFDRDVHIPIIIKNMESNTPIITFLEREKKGAFYKETILKSTYHQSDLNRLSDDEKLKIESVDSQWDGGRVPLKSSKNILSNYKKYGYFTSGQYAYFVLIKYVNEKGKEFKKFVAMPILYVKNIKNSTDLVEAIKQLNGIDNVEILIDKIKIGTILKVGCGYFKLAGNTGDSLVLHNFNQAFLDVKLLSYFKLISKFNFGVKNKVEYKEIDEKIEIKNNRFNQAEYLTKEGNLQIFEALLMQFKLPNYKYVNIGIQAKLLSEKKELFKGLTVKEQIKVINGMMDILVGVNGADLTIMGGSAHAGKLTLNKKIDCKTAISIIYYSNTGFYKREVKIN